MASTTKMKSTKHLHDLNHVHLGLPSRFHFSDSESCVFTNSEATFRTRMFQRKFYWVSPCCKYKAAHSGPASCESKTLSTINDWCLQQWVLHNTMGDVVSDSVPNYKYTCLASETFKMCSIPHKHIRWTNQIKLQKLRLPFSNVSNSKEMGSSFVCPFCLM